MVRHLLSTVTIVPLDKHDLLRNRGTLLNSPESEDATGARIGLLVAVSDTHASTGGDVKASELAILVHDSDETDIVRKDIDVIVGWNSDGDFELWTGQPCIQGTSETRTLRGR